MSVKKKLHLRKGSPKYVRRIMNYKCRCVTLCARAGSSGSLYFPQYQSSSREQSKNFLVHMYKGYQMVAWPNLSQENFFTKMNQIVKALHTRKKAERNPVFTKGPEFSEHIKTIMAKINHNDWRSLSAQFFTNRIEVSLKFISSAPICEFFADSEEMSKKFHINRLFKASR